MSLFNSHVTVLLVYAMLRPCIAAMPLPARSHDASCKMPWHVCSESSIYPQATSHRLSLHDLENCPHLLGGMQSGAACQMCSAEYFTIREDRPVVREVTDYILEHHLFEREYVRQVRYRGEHEVVNTNAAVEGELYLYHSSTVTSRDCFHISFGLHLVVGMPGNIAILCRVELTSVFAGASTVCNLLILQLDHSSASTSNYAEAALMPALNVLN